MDVETLIEQTRAIHSGKKWIVCVDVAALAGQLVERLYEEGATGVMVVAGNRGTGDLPVGADIFFTDAHGTSVMSGIRAFLETVEQPSRELLDAVGRFDPEGEAMVLGGGFSRKSELCGRPVFGGERPEWRALEDKMVVDDIWERAEVAHAPYEIVDVDGAPAAAARLRTPLGSVWTADNTEGWHGGGEYTRWLRTTEDELEAVAWFAERARRVRVMPFLDGIPCSIHGFVTDDGVAVFLPFELFILRPEDSQEFFYAQGANYWIPPQWVEDEMRNAARNVGALLKSELGYRGGFGIDGVATRDGFRPNELNPRGTIAIFHQLRTADIPPGDLSRGVLSGEIDVPAAWLEETVVAAVRGQRRGGAIVMIYAEHEADKTWLSFTEDAVEPATEEDHDVSVSLGPAAFGSVAIISVFESAVEPGPSFAPRIVKIIDHIRALWDLEIPIVTAAPDVLTGGD